MNIVRAKLLRFASLIVFFLGLAPLAYAQTGTAPADTLGTFILQIITFIDQYLVPVIFAIAFIVFLWGIYSTFIAGANNEEKRQEGQRFAMYGLIGFFLMLSVWGILNLLINTFGFGSSSRPALPTFGAPSTVNTTTTNPTSICPPGYSDSLDGQGCQPNASAQTPAQTQPSGGELPPF